MIRVAVWEEYIQSRDQENVKQHYPQGIHHYIGSFLQTEEALSVQVIDPHSPEHGLTEEVLANTDVLFWWAHEGHAQISDAVVERIYQHVLKGMGVVFLHSSHLAKPFLRLMGTSGTLRWREDGAKERLWVIDPGHPLLAGVEDDYIDLESEEMYGEYFDIPKPEAVPLIGWYPGGEVFRSLCVWTRGYGKVVYFQPGHESFPTYHHPAIQQILKNAASYVYTPKRRAGLDCPMVPRLED